MGMGLFTLLPSMKPITRMHLEGEIPGKLPGCPSPAFCSAAGLRPRLAAPGQRPVRSCSTRPSAAAGLGPLCDANHRLRRHHLAVAKNSVNG